MAGKNHVSVNGISSSKFTTVESTRDQGLGKAEKKKESKDQVRASSGLGKKTTPSLSTSSAVGKKSEDPNRSLVVTSKEDENDINEGNEENTNSFRESGKNGVGVVRNQVKAL